MVSFSHLGNKTPSKKKYLSPAEIGGGGSGATLPSPAPQPEAPRSKPPVAPSWLKKAPSCSYNKAKGLGKVRQPYYANLDSVDFVKRHGTKLFVNYPNDSKTYWCSATLIGYKTLITAAHCFYRASRGGWASNVAAVPGLDQEYMPFGYANSTLLIAPSGWTDDENDDYDWGLILLDRELGRPQTAGHLGFAHLSDSSFENLIVEMNGYPDAFGLGAISTNSPGMVSCTDSTMVYHNAITSDGLSGAGLLPWGNHPQKERVVAVNTGTDFNLLCSLQTQMSRSTRINSDRYNLILQNLDDPSIPIVNGDQSGWTSFGGPAYTAVTSLSHAPDHFDMYMRGNNGEVQMRQKTPSGWWPSSSTWASIGGPVLGKVAAVSRSPHVVDLFMREDSGAQFQEETRVCTKARSYSTWWPSQSAWYCFDDLKTVEWPAAVSTGPGNLEVFAVSSSGAVRSKVWSDYLGVGWLPTLSVGLGGYTRHPVAVVSRAPGRWDAFLRDGLTRQLCTKSWDGSVYWPSQLGWFCFGGTDITTTPVVVSVGTNALDVFAPRTGGGVTRAYWRGGSWQTMNLGGSVQGPLTVASRFSGQFDLFAVNSTGTVLTKSFNGVFWWPSQTGWASLGGDAIDVAVVSQAFNRLHVHARSRDDLFVMERWWDGQQWWL